MEASKAKSGRRVNARGKSWTCGLIWLEANWSKVYPNKKAKQWAWAGANRFTGIPVPHVMGPMDVLHGFKLGHGHAGAQDTVFLSVTGQLHSLSAPLGNVPTVK